LVRKNMEESTRRARRKAKTAQRREKTQEKLNKLVNQRVVFIRIHLHDRKIG